LAPNPTFAEGDQIFEAAASPVAHPLSAAARSKRLCVHLADFLTKIAPGDLDIAIIGQLPAAQLALDD
jgi:hypothetical protein